MDTQKEKQTYESLLAEVGKWSEKNIETVEVDLGFIKEIQELGMKDRIVQMYRNIRNLKAVIKEGEASYKDVFLFFATARKRFIRVNNIDEMTLIKSLHLVYLYDDECREAFADYLLKDDYLGTVTFSDDAYVCWVCAKLFQYGMLESQVNDNVIAKSSIIQLLNRPLSFYLPYKKTDLFLKGSMIGNVINNTTLLIPSEMIMLELLQINKIISNYNELVAWSQSRTVAIINVLFRKISSIILDSKRIADIEGKINITIMESLVHTSEAYVHIKKINPNIIIDINYFYEIILHVKDSNNNLFIDWSLYKKVKFLYENYTPESDFWNVIIHHKNSPTKIFNCLKKLKAPEHIIMGRIRMRIFNYYETLWKISRLKIPSITVAKANIKCQQIIENIKWNKQDILILPEKYKNYTSVEFEGGETDEEVNPLPFMFPLFYVDAKKID